MAQEKKMRDYLSAPQHVVETYRKMHQQTYQGVLQLRQELAQRKTLTIPFWDLFFYYYCTVVDESDPDLVSHPQWLHCLQSAEAARKANQPDWMQLLCLIHDVGKFKNSSEMAGLPQYQTVGDTYPVGCAPRQQIVYYDQFKTNPDTTHPIYGSRLGVYEEKCGLDALIFVPSHDTFLADAIKTNKKPELPEAFEYVVRYHSFYPWHHGNAYTQFQNEKDISLKSWVLQFNKYDLYSKDDGVNIQEEQAHWKANFPYYQKLFEKYFHPVWTVA